MSQKLVSKKFFFNARDVINGYAPYSGQLISYLLGMYCIYLPLKYCNEKVCSYAAQYPRMNDINEYKSMFDKQD